MISPGDCRMSYIYLLHFPANFISLYFMELEDKVGGAEWAAVKLKGWMLLTLSNFSYYRYFYIKELKLIIGKILQA